jgi:uncharacterized protein (TIGR02145 family)
MKTKFFFFAMLVSIVASAQSHINIQMIGATYTASPAVQFRISWSSVPTITGQTHNAKIWVWVDFLKVNADNTTAGNTWTRAEITATPAVTSSPTSTATLESGNNKGFWLNGVTGSYSATITAALSNIPANTKFNWCAYTSDCPPNVTLDNGTYTFKGTPPFTLIASNGTTTQIVSGKTLTASALNITPTTIRDKTECPGVFCIYTGSDLYIDATHLCQQRTSGAKNWEAWIKDTRDNELYRIVLMPDNNWWLAQNVKLASYGGSTKGSTISGCTAEECGRAYSWAQTYASYGGSSGSTTKVQGICPPGWLLPLRASYDTLAKHIGDRTAVCANLRSLNSSCTATPENKNTYGWASQVGVGNGTKATLHSYYYTNDNGREDGIQIDCYDPSTNKCNYYITNNDGDSGNLAVVRCFRKLLFLILIVRINRRKILPG